jgi:hypothetical protein
MYAPPRHAVCVGGKQNAPATAALRLAGRPVDGYRLTLRELAHAAPAARPVKSTQPRLPAAVTAGSCRMYLGGQGQWSGPWQRAARQGVGKAVCPGTAPAWPRRRRRLLLDPLPRPRPGLSSIASLACAARDSASHANPRGVRAGRRRPLLPLGGPGARVCVAFVASVGRGRNGEAAARAPSDHRHTSWRATRSPHASARWQRHLAMRKSSLIRTRVALHGRLPESSAARFPSRLLEV